MKFILRNGRDMLKCVQVEADYFYFRGKLNLKSVCMKKALSDVVKSLEAEEEYAQRMQSLKMTREGQIQFDVYTLMNEALESLTQTMRAAREKCREALEKLEADQLEWNAVKMKRKEDTVNAKMLHDVQDDLDRELRDLNVFYSLLQNTPRDDAMEKDLQENYQYIVYLDGILERILKQRVQLTSVPLALHIYKELFGNWRRKLKRVSIPHTLCTLPDNSRQSCCSR